MVTLKTVEKRLAAAGFNNKFWGKPEMRELENILADDEEIVCAVSGRYEAGFALLISTDRRLLLIDKKPLFLSLEDLRYDMISEIDFGAQAFMATVAIHTINKTLRFQSIRQNQLRALTAHVQHRVMELRHNYQQPQTQEQTWSNNLPTQAEDQQPAWYPVSNRAVLSEPPTTAFMAQRTALPASPLTMHHRVSRFPVGIAHLSRK